MLDEIARTTLRRLFWLGFWLRLGLGHRLPSRIGLWIWVGHLGVCRRHRPRRDHLVRLAIAIGIHDTEIVLGMLIEILGGNPISRRCGLACERDVTLENLVRIAADFNARAAAFEYLHPMWWPRPVALLLLMMTAATVMVPAAVPLALALSHHALEVLVGHHPPLG